MSAMVGIIAILIAIVSVSISSVNAAPKSSATWKTEDNGEFLFKYTVTWKLKEKENRFTSIDDTLDYDRGGKSGQIVFEHDPAFSDRMADSDANLTIEVMSKVLTSQHTDANIFESGLTKYTINNQTAPYAIATYTNENLFGFKKDWVIMIILIPLGNDDFVLAQYVAGENDFDKLNGDVERIFQSVGSAVPEQSPVL